MASPLGRMWRSVKVSTLQLRWPCSVSSVAVELRFSLSPCGAFSSLQLFILLQEQISNAAEECPFSCFGKGVCETSKRERDAGQGGEGEIVKKRPACAMTEMASLLVSLGEIGPELTEVREVTGSSDILLDAGHSALDLPQLGEDERVLLLLQRQRALHRLQAEQRLVLDALAEEVEVDGGALLRLEQFGLALQPRLPQPAPHLPQRRHVLVGLHGLHQLEQLLRLPARLRELRPLALRHEPRDDALPGLRGREGLREENAAFLPAHSQLQVMSELEKTVERKVQRMEQEYYDLVIKTEFLKSSKQRIKKDIDFYKAAISKLAFIYDLNAE